MAPSPGSRLRLALCLVAAVLPAAVHAAAPDGRSFDHARFDALLRSHVDGAGLVDYAGLSRESQALDAYLASLASAPFEQLGRDEKLALLWDDRRWMLAGETGSLDQIEHERIRAAFREPRIHFALVCAARSCPPLPAPSVEQYVAAYQPSVRAALGAGQRVKIRWLPYDWSLNERR